MKPRIFTWSGVPRGQGRPRFTRTGRAYKADKDREYERSIRAAYLEWHRDKRPIDGPFRVSVEVWMQVPRTASRNKREDMLIDRIRPTVKPDLDNVVKAVLDALNGIAYTDDKALVQIEAKKLYCACSGLYVVISPVGVKET